MTNKWEIIPTISCLFKADTESPIATWRFSARATSMAVRFPSPSCSGSAPASNLEVTESHPQQCGLSPKKQWDLQFIYGPNKAIGVDSHTKHHSSDAEVITIHPNLWYLPQLNWAFSLRHLILNTSRWNTLNSWIYCIYIYMCVCKYNII